MGIVDLNFGTDGAEKDRILKKPERYREKFGVWARKHPQISLVTGTLFVLLLLYGILPLGALYFLPSWIVKQLVYFLTAGTFGFYAGRHLWKRHGSVPTERIYTLNLANTPMITPYQTLRGNFKQLFDFKNGQPVESTNKFGEPTYTVIKLDFQNQDAYCSWWGDLPQAKLFEKKEAIRAQFFYNDKLRKLGAEFNMRMDQIVSQVEHDYANAFIRKMQTVTHPEDMLEEAEDGLPSSSVDIKTPDLEDIAEKAGIENMKGLEPENKPERER